MEVDGKKFKYAIKKKKKVRFKVAAVSGNEVVIM